MIQVGKTEKSKNNITWPKYLYFYTEEVLAQPYGSAAVAAWPLNFCKQLTSYFNIDLTKTMYYNGQFLA